MTRCETQVTGQLSTYSAEKVAAGLHHVAVLASPVERRLRRAAGPSGTSVVLTWGRGTEGQLGSGGHTDSGTPRVVDGALKGRQILQACAQYFMKCPSPPLQPIRNGLAEGQPV